MKRDNVLLARVRRLCLSLPETSEVGSWGHPNFRAGKRTFVTLEWVKGRASLAFRLNPTDVDLLLHKKGFFETPYGRGQWVSLWADGRLDWRLIGRLVEQSYRGVALKRMTATLDSRKVAGRVSAVLGHVNGARLSIRAREGARAVRVREETPRTA